MDRTVYIDIAGKEYPMRFSLGASMAIANKFGSLKKMQEELTNSENEAKALETMSYILSALIKQGCAYKNLFEQDIPARPNANIKDGKYIALEQEAVEAGLEMWEMEEATKKIFEVIAKGNEREVNAKVKEEKGARKNAGPT